MLSLSFALVLIPYGLALLFFALMALVNVYHLIHYGATTAISFVVTFLFLAGAVFILFFTWQALQNVDWNRAITIEVPTVVIPSLK